MNIMEAITALQDFRANLEQWGITNETLIFIAVVALVLFIISAREVLGWFFKTHMIRDEIRDLRREVLQLKEVIHELHEIKEKPELQKPEKISAAKTGSGTADSEERPGISKFRLDH